FPTCTQLIASSIIPVSSHGQQLGRRVSGSEAARWPPRHSPRPYPFMPHTRPLLSSTASLNFPSRPPSLP
ncbi:unnamed protein product, partial [Closterium sp. NIES-53]